MTTKKKTSTQKASKRSTVKAKASKKLAIRARVKNKVQKVMHEYKEGTLHSGSDNGPKVKYRKQAIAIALSEAGVSKKKATKKKRAN